MADQLTSPLDYAQAYAGIGWAVLPLHWIDDTGNCSCGNPACRSPGKHPLTANGVKAASKQQDVLAGWWATWPNANVGVATGLTSGITVIDVDPRNGGETPPGLPDTVMALTGGGGFHYVFAHRAGVPGKLGPGIDVKNDGGYIVVEPSNHTSGKRYAWEGMSSPLDGVPCAPFPAGLVPALGGSRASVAAGATRLPSAEVHTIRMALSYVDPDERDEWIAVGQALKSTGAEEQAFGLWDEWSKRSDDYDASDMHTRWKGFAGGRTGIGAIINRAKAHGWVPIKLVEPEPVGKPPACGRTATPRVPEQLLTVPGVLGEIANWTYATAYRPQRVLAVATALSLGATAMARRYRLNGLRTNLYLLSIAPTGAGKEQGRSVLKGLLTAAGLRGRIGGEEIASGTALVTRASLNPDVVFALDEFGLFMQAISNPRAGKHTTDLMSALMKFYSNADSIYTGIEYADQKLRPRQDIEFPCVNLYATTTGDTLWPALNHSHVASGFLNRILVMEVDTPNQKHSRTRLPLDEIPAEFAEWIRGVAGRKPEMDEPNLRGTPGKPFEMSFDEGAGDLMEEFVNSCEERMHGLRGTQLDALWVRTHEHAMKISMIVAASLDPSSLVVSKPAVEWACAFAEFWTNHLISLIGSKVVVTDFERARMGVLKALSDSVTPLTSRELGQKCTAFSKLEEGAKNEVILSLIGEKRLEVIEKKGRAGPSTKVYILTGPIESMSAP